MAVTRAEKETELNMLAGVFKGADAAILIDYRGINVPQVTELRAQLRKAKAGYKVVKNSLAKRALQGTDYETFDATLEGTTAVAFTTEDPVALAKTLTTFMKNAPTLQIKAAVVQGRNNQAGRSQRTGGPAWQARAVREAAVRDPGADGAAGERAQRRAARPDQRAGAGGEEAGRG